jgi:hypothetical protein
LGPGQKCHCCIQQNKVYSFSLASDSGKEVVNEGQSEEVASEAGQEVASEAGVASEGQEVASEASQEVASEAGQEVASEAGQEVASEAGQDVASEASEEVASEGQSKDDQVAVDPGEWMFALSDCRDGQLVILSSWTAAQVPEYVQRPFDMLPGDDFAAIQVLIDGKCPVGPPSWQS